jgi:hypothetical protein
MLVAAAAAALTAAVSASGAAISSLSYTLQNPIKIAPTIRMNHVATLLTLLIVSLLFLAIFRRREGFGTSPGTLVQLATSHVPTTADIPLLKEWMKERDAGIKQMTESDLIAGLPIEYDVLGTRIGAFN